jgi:hypothetical protein
MEKGMKKGGKCMAKGGEARMEPATMEKLPKGNRKFGEHADQKKGHTKGKNLGDSGRTEGSENDMYKLKRYAKGGMTRGDGCASKGKTKTKIV